MKRELGIARCGLACCLCGESEHCAGCDSGDCPDKEECANRAWSLERGIAHCFDCSETDCKQGMLQKSKPYGFTAFARRYGEQALLDCLERNEEQGVVYHREGVVGVDLNDEATSLMTYQKAYTAACRLMTTLEEALDSLINAT